MRACLLGVTDHYLTRRRVKPNVRKSDTERVFKAYEERYEQQTGSTPVKLVLAIR